MSTAYDGPVQDGPHGAADDQAADHDARRTNQVSVTHLVFGLAFLGLAAFWALATRDVIEPDAGWAVPLVLVFAGLGGLVPTVVRAVRRR